MTQKNACLNVDVHERVARAADGGDEVAVSSHRVVVERAIEVPARALVRVAQVRVVARDEDDTLRGRDR
eukprot:31374-Pelagococcus_subviridis.AAC.10